MGVLKVEMEPIGVVRTDAGKVPRSWRTSEAEGTLEIENAYEEGLVSIVPGERIVVLFNFHESPVFSPERLRQTPPRADGDRGIFSTLSPVRPNPIGMSVLEVLEVEGTSLRVRGLDMRDGTPVLDIKPWPGDKGPADRR